MPSRLSFEQIGLGAKAGLDVAQALPENELGEGHAKELVPRREASALPQHGVIGYATIELRAIDRIDNLRENKTVGVHASQSQ